MLLTEKFQNEFIQSLKNSGYDNDVIEKFRALITIHNHVENNYIIISEIKLDKITPQLIKMLIENNISFSEIKALTTFVQRNDIETVKYILDNIKKEHDLEVYKSLRLFCIKNGFVEIDKLLSEYVKISNFDEMEAKFEYRCMHELNIDDMIDNISTDLLKTMLDNCIQFNKFITAEKLLTKVTHIYTLDQLLKFSWEEAKIKFILAHNLSVEPFVIAKQCCLDGNNNNMAVVIAKEYQHIMNDLFIFCYGINNYDLCFQLIKNGADPRILEKNDIAILLHKIIAIIK